MFVFISIFKNLPLDIIYLAFWWWWLLLLFLVSSSVLRLRAVPCLPHPNPDPVSSELLSLFTCTNRMQIPSFWGVRELCAQQNIWPQNTFKYRCYPLGQLVIILAQRKKRARGSVEPWTGRGPSVSHSDASAETKSSNDLICPLCHCFFKFF